MVLVVITASQALTMAIDYLASVNKPDCGRANNGALFACVDPQVSLVARLLKNDEYDGIDWVVDT